MTRLLAGLALVVAALACVCSSTPALASATRATRRHGRCATRASSHQHRQRSCQARTRSRRAKPSEGGGRAHARRGVPTVLASATATASTSALTIARALATPCQNADLMPEVGNLEIVRDAVLCLINRVRAQDGESPLLANPQLEQAAQGHTQEMITADYFEHVSPSGVTPVGRDETSGYIPNSTVGYVIGENLAWGTLGLATPQAIVAAWTASPGHLANILEGQYRDTGIADVAEVPAGLAGGSSRGATYAQEFGVIIH